MTWSYDITTSVGCVRRDIPDRDESNPIFSNEEIESWLSEENNSIKRATARALGAIASDQALVLKVITLQNLTTDGARVSDALLKRADKLIAAAEYDEQAAGGGFDYAEQVNNDFGERELIVKSIERNV